jgi:hypothetical protein
MKTIKIGVSCTPSTYIVSHEIIQGKKVLVSYGGGLGGTSKIYFCKEVYEPKPAESMRLLILLTGEVVRVNGRFIVEISDREIVKVISNITGHMNYNKKIYSKVIETEYFELLYGEKPMFISDYTARHDGDLAGRTISRTEEIDY